MGPKDTLLSDGDHNPQQAVRADTFDQVEPPAGNDFVVRPYSLTAAELGGLPASTADTPIPVRAWVRYPAIARQVHGVAVAWTPRAVYVQWDDTGLHRAWVWASAVERTPAHHPAPTPAPAPTSTSAASSSSPPPRGPEHSLTARDTRALVVAVNAELTHNGAEFRTSMAQATGPFSAVVFGTIDARPVRLEFFIEPATNRCAVHLFDMPTKTVLRERTTADTFSDAIQLYPWPAVLDALPLT